MAPIIFTCGAGLVSLLSFLITCNKKRSVVGVFNKTLVSIFFILTAVFAVLNKGVGNLETIRYGLLVIAGLVFGLLGDIFLDQKWVYPDHMAEYLNAGFLTFGIGHMFYIFAMAKHFSFGVRDFIFPLAFSVAVTVINALIEKFTKEDFGKFRAAVTAYTVVISFMCGTAVWSALRDIKAGMSVPSIFLAIGAILFLLSDVILAPMYFEEGKNTPKNFVLNHVTYYMGQYLIALSIFVL